MHWDAMATPSSTRRPSTPSRPTASSSSVALPEGAHLFSRSLASAGYDCGMIGKMHLAACFGGRTEPRPANDGYRF